MISSFSISLDGLTEQEYRYLIRKHTKEFNVSYITGFSLKTGFYARVKGDLRNIINMLDFLASNGFTVELISAK